MGRWQAASPQRRPDGDRHDPYGHTDTYDHSHGHADPDRDEYPHAYCYPYPHRYEHGDGDGDYRACSDLTTCTIHR